MRGAGREVGRGRSRKNRQSESEGGVSGRGGREGGGREEEGAWGGAQGTDVLVCISLQDDRYSRSALHWASEGGLAGTVAQLVSLGADATLKNENGCTALWLACAKQHEGAAAELMEATKLAGALDLQVPHEAGQGGCVV